MFLFVNKSQEKTKTNNALQVLPVFPDPDIQQLIPPSLSSTVVPKPLTRV